MGKFSKDGHDLLDELEATLGNIESRANSRHDVVNTRLQELEAEKHALSTVRSRVAAVRGSNQDAAS